MRQRRTILLVEDDEYQREDVAYALRRVGYDVVEAVDAASALEVLRAGAAVDVLFTDIVLPGPLNGPALAQKALELRPALAVLFTSGYSPDAIFENASHRRRAHFLQKPYTYEELCRKLAAAVDGGPID